MSARSYKTPSCRGTIVCGTSRARNELMKPFTSGRPLVSTTAAVLALLLCCALSRDASAQHGSAPAQPLSWIAGCWRQTSGNGSRVVDEQWMSLRGGVMLGMSRTVRGDSLLELEFLQILERSGRLVYHAQPSGQRPADFEATVVSDT